MIAIADLKAAFSELSNQRDEKIQAAINRAYATVSRYIAPADFGALAIAAIDNAALPIARAYIADVNALGAEHPVVRDLDEAIVWLKMVARGKAFLPTEPVSTEHQAPVMGAFGVSSGSKVFNNAVLSKMM